MPRLIQRPLRKHVTKQVKSGEFPPARQQCNGTCGRELPFTSDYFPLNKRSKWGLTTTCLECSAEQSRQSHLRKEMATAMTGLETEMAKAKVKTHDPLYDEDGFTVAVRFNCAIHRLPSSGEVRYYKDGMYSRSIGFAVQPGIGPVCSVCLDNLLAWKEAQDERK